MGEEVGENGTPHLQGYIEFTNSKKLEWLRKINPRIHWEARRGTAQQARDYCAKEGEFWEWGELSKQGKRSDLDNVAEAIRDGVSISDLCKDYGALMIRYGQSVVKYRGMCMEERKEAPTVRWIWGATGTGKTRQVRDSHESLYFKNRSKWWDGYEGQEAIIIDDFDARSWDFRDILRLLDRYPYRGELKGGHTQINSPYIYITCDRPPYRFWQGIELEQIMRRINYLIETESRSRSEER